MESGAAIARRQPLNRCWFLVLELEKPGSGRPVYRAAVHRLDLRGKYPVNAPVARTPGYVQPRIAAVTHSTNPSIGFISFADARRERYSY